MSTDPSKLSDDELSKFVFESALTIKKLTPSPNTVFQRIATFNAMYEALADRPKGAALLYGQGGSTTQSHVIGNKVVVGRLARSEQNPSGCDLAVKDAEMSRKHFEITLNDDDLFVLGDSGSRNGTSINGNPQILENAILKGGDIILAGNTTFAFTGA